MPSSSASWRHGHARSSARCLRSRSCCAPATPRECWWSTPPPGVTRFPPSSSSGAIMLNERPGSSTSPPRRGRRRAPRCAGSNPGRSSSTRHAARFSRRPSSGSSRSTERQESTPIRRRCGSSLRPLRALPPGSPSCFATTPRARRRWFSCTTTASCVNVRPRVITPHPAASRRGRYTHRRAPPPASPRAGRRPTTPRTRERG